MFGRAHFRNFTGAPSRYRAIRHRFVYFADEFHPGAVIELSEVQGPKGRMFDLIRDASVHIARIEGRLDERE